MKIERIMIWQLDLPLHWPYRLSGGRLGFDCLDSTLARIDIDAGVRGVRRAGFFSDTSAGAAP